MFSTWFGLCQIQRFAKGTETDKVLRDKAFKIASNPNHYGYQKGLASMVFTSFL